MRLLVMLGDKPLTAPRVMGPITGGGFQIQFRSQGDLKQTEYDLKKLKTNRNGVPQIGVKSGSVPQNRI